MLYVVVHHANTLELRVGMFGHALLAIQAEKFSNYVKDITPSTMKATLKELLTELEDIEKYMTWKEKHVVSAGELHFVENQLVKINLDSGAFHFKNITEEQAESISSVIRSFTIFKDIPISTIYEGSGYANPFIAKNTNKIESSRDGINTQFKSMGLTATISEESHVAALSETTSAEDVSAKQDGAVGKHAYPVYYIPSQQTLFVAKPSKPKNHVVYSVKPSSGA